MAGEQGIPRWPSRDILQIDRQVAQLLSQQAGPLDETRRREALHLMAQRDRLVQGLPVGTRPSADSVCVVGCCLPHPHTACWDRAHGALRSGRLA